MIGQVVSVLLILIEIAVVLDDRHALRNDTRCSILTLKIHEKVVDAFAAFLRFARRVFGECDFFLSFVTRPPRGLTIRLTRRAN